MWPIWTSTNHFGVFLKDLQKELGEQIGNEVWVRTIAEGTAVKVGGRDFIRWDSIPKQYKC